MAEFGKYVIIVQNVLLIKIILYKTAKDFGANGSKSAFEK